MTNNIIAIDPGTHFTGIAILNNINNVINVAYIETINTLSYIHLYKDIEYLYGLRQAKITIVCNRLYQLFTIYEPYEIVCEAPFFNPKRPQAFLALAELIACIRQLIQTRFYSLKLTLIDPSTIKNSLGVSGISGNKLLIKDALLKQNLSYGIGVNLLNCDEHSLDAIAVGYCNLTSVIY